jgi:hypothetical protein
MNAMLPGEIDAGQSAMIKRREKLSTLGGISAGRTAMSRNSVLVHARVCSTPRRRRTGGRRLSAYGRTKAQPIELVWTRAQADFDVGQAISVSYLGESHGQELVPTREVTNPIVALIAVDTTAKLFAMNPVHDLTENRLFGAHWASLALPVLRKSAKRSQNRSHHFHCVTLSGHALSSKRHLSKPDDSDLEHE